MGRRGCYSYCYFYVLIQFLNVAPKHNCYKCDYGLSCSPDLSQWGGRLNGQESNMESYMCNSSCFLNSAPNHNCCLQERPEVTMFMFMWKWVRVKMLLMQVFMLEASLVIDLSDTNFIPIQLSHELVLQAKAMRGISFKELHNSTMPSNLLRNQLKFGDM